MASLGVVAQENAPSTSGKILYENNLEKAELDKVPSDFLVLDGGFAVKQEGENKFLELPGAPLETFGVLFGPTTNANVAVTAKIRGTIKGRRYPTFAVGLNGVSGYRLQVSRAKNLIELYKGDDVVVSAPFEEKLDSWFVLQLENRKVGENEWKFTGKVWREKSPEPKEAIIQFTEKAEPVAGRASIWGMPFSGKPIQFDDLKVVSVDVAK
jgi:hypothetical protein